ncbi:WD40-repeat-containing domain protein [Gorgonomyces haynaldii]|nr:WD40-repeat-containing domain protein [Gorgonomyces haynaldii]
MISEIAEDDEESILTPHFKVPQAPWDPVNKQLQNIQNTPRTLERRDSEGSLDSETKSKRRLSTKKEKKKRDTPEPLTLTKKNSLRQASPLYDPMTLFIDTFPSLPASNRHFFLLQLLKQCDPSDMLYLNTTIPILHRDFIGSLPLDLSYRIINHVKPRDIATIARVCSKWNNITKKKDLWFTLYRSLGLESMAHVFYKSQNTIKENCKRYESIGNWAHGEFKTRSFKAHDMGILCIAFDGQYLLTGSTDKSCKLFSVAHNTLIKTYLGHEQGVSCCQFDQDKVITGSIDGTLRIYHRESTNCKHCLVGHTEPVTCLVFQNNLLVSGSQDGHVRLWSDIQTKSVECVRLLTGHEGGIKCLALSGNCLQVLGFNSLFELQSLGVDEHSTRPKLDPTQVLVDPISSIEMDHERMLIATLSGHLHLFHLKPPPMDQDPTQSYFSSMRWLQQDDVFTLDKHVVLPKQGSVWQLCSRHDRWRLMSGTSEGTCSVWNHRTGKLLYTLETKKVDDNAVKGLTSISKGGNGALTGLAFDDFYIVAGGTDGIVRIWEPILE